MGWARIKTNPMRLAHPHHQGGQPMVKDIQKRPPGRIFLGHALDQPFCQWTRQGSHRPGQPHEPDHHFIRLVQRLRMVGFNRTGWKSQRGVGIEMHRFPAGVRPLPHGNEFAVGINPDTAHQFCRPHRLIEIKAIGTVAQFLDQRRN